MQRVSPRNRSGLTVLHRAAASNAVRRRGGASRRWLRRTPSSPAPRGRAGGYGRALPSDHFSTSAGVPPTRDDEADVAAPAPESVTMTWEENAQAIVTADSFRIARNSPANALGGLVTVQNDRHVGARKPEADFKELHDAARIGGPASTTVLRNAGRAIDWRRDDLRAFWWA